MTCGFVLTWLFGYKNTNTVKEVKENENIDKENLIKQEIYVTPVQGEVVSLESVDDPVFASGTIGKGIAIKPSEGKVYAPCDGTAVTVFPTGHALGIQTKANAELLIHIGIDTVQLEGEGFISHVKQGENIKKGQLLVEFDQEYLKNKGYDDTVMFVVTNASSFLDVVASNDEKAEQNKEILAIAI